MKALIQFTLGICGLGLLSGCGEAPDQDKIRRQGFVFCGQEGTPASFNPQLVESGITSESLSPQLFDSLLTLDSDTHEPTASLASSWFVNKEGTEYLFDLRQDVEFQTTDWFTPSRKLNASDVVFSFNRILDSNNPYHLVSDHGYPWFSAIDFVTQVKRVEAVSDHQVKFVLNQPDNTFLSNIATTYSVIHSKEYADKLAEQNQKHLLDQKPVGTGPFYLDDYQAGDLVRLRRHNQYWRGQPNLEQIVFDISSRGTGPLAKLLRNECDVLNSPISSHIPIIKEQSFLTLDARSSMNVAYIAINTEHNALKDVRVRKALNLAINRKNILDSVYYGTGEQAYSLLPPNSWAYQKDTVQFRYDRNYALALLREAGYLDGLSLSMWVSLDPTAYNPSPRKTAELIQAAFADIGVKLELFSSDQFDRSELADNSKIDLVLTGWSASTGDPDNFLRPLLSCNAEQSGLNVSMWCNQDFDFLLDLAKETNQLRYRKNLYKQAQHIMNEEVPVIPLAHGAQFQAYHNSLQGFDISPFSSQSFHKVERKK
ncbi:ABC transporter substrate-binding protein SapA [Vibrio sp. SCSIO 43137]|uniref:ABC transporter substrate-binding protein SapA n=1 Tax=Vibrio sp. SCSIO 43137 TaxID=3021011 RepID=UPI002306FAFB|nr:ABC transporter substrate-binding protein SapA [Vibrio sp. SCSIO 43137]WCE28536.1 peptide ABC transporter substrate-binding protein SapA [Vibrio sp. SCSIO 43137]